MKAELEACSFGQFPTLRMELLELKKAAKHVSELSSSPL